MAEYYEDNSRFSEGVGYGGGYPFANWSGGQDYQNHGGTGDAYNPHGSANPYYGFVVQGGGFNQGFVSGGPQTNSSAAHYYSGYWAGVQAAMYAPQPLPSSPAPYPIPGYGPDEPFPIPNAHPLQQGDVTKALTSANEFPWGHRVYIPFGSELSPGGPFLLRPPHDEPWAHPPWVQPEEWPQVVDPYISASASAAERVNPELNYLEQDPSNFIIDNIDRLIFDSIRPMTNQDAARIGHIDTTPGNATSNLTPANIPSNIFPGSVGEMWGLAVDFGGPATSFKDGIIDSTGFFLDQ